MTAISLQEAITYRISSIIKSHSFETVTDFTLLKKEMRFEKNKLSDVVFNCQGLGSSLTSYVMMDFDTELEIEIA